MEWEQAGSPACSFFAAWSTRMRIPLRLLRDCKGASAAEYALILAILGTGIAIAALALGQNIANALGATGTAIVTCANQC
jgi:pilus assembly protein Flp/PilA